MLGHLGFQLRWRVRHARHRARHPMFCYAAQTRPRPGGSRSDAGCVRLAPLRLQDLFLREHLVEVQLRATVPLEELARCVEVQRCDRVITTQPRDFSEALVAAPCVDEVAHVGARGPLEPGAEMPLGVIDASETEREPAAHVVRVSGMYP